MFFKKLGIYSLILGAISGIISLIPPLMPAVAFFILPVFGAVAVLVYMMKKDNFAANEVKTFAILGGLSGVVIAAAFLVAFIPLVEIIYLINKNYYDYGIQALNLFLCVLLFGMIAATYFLTSCVAGLLTGAIYTYFKGKNNG